MSHPITSELIARTGAALGEGGWRYTPRQLYYATCAAAEAPQRAPARGPLALGVLLGLVALILLPLRPAAIAVGVLAAVSLTFAAIAKLTYQRPSGRPLALSFREFEELLREQEAPAGLITARAERSPSRTAQLGDDSVTRDEHVSVVCDTEENMTSVVANLERAKLGNPRVISVDMLSEAVLSGAVIALHDASPHGCALPLQLVEAGASAVDAGLRPAWVDGADSQVLEGAPARLPRDLSSLLREDEVDWLRSGRRVELAVLPPARLMQLVTAAVDHAKTLAPMAPEPSRHEVSALSVLPALP